MWASGLVKGQKSSLPDQVLFKICRGFSKKNWYAHILVGHHILVSNQEDPWFSNYVCCIYVGTSYATDRAMLYQIREEFECISEFGGECYFPSLLGWFPIHHPS